MAKERIQRRLAAILATDVVGYSRMIDADEAAPGAAEGRTGPAAGRERRSEGNITFRLTPHPERETSHDPRHPYTRALIAAHPEPDIDHRLDLAAVAYGAGEPETWPGPFRYEGDAVPGFIKVAPGHLVRSAR